MTGPQPTSTRSPSSTHSAGRLAELVKHRPVRYSKDFYPERDGGDCTCPAACSQSVCRMCGFLAGTGPRYVLVAVSRGGRRNHVSIVHQGRPGTLRPTEMASGPLYGALGEGDVRAPYPPGTSRAAGPALGPGSFRRIVDVPFETCVTELDSWQQAEQGGEVRFGDSLLCGPAERDPGSATYRIQVRLARGALRPLLRMRIDIDRWSSSSTALELIPGGHVRPTAAYFRAGHLLLDSLTRHLLQPSPPAQVRDTASRPPAPVGAGRP